MYKGNCLPAACLEEVGRRDRTSQSMQGRQEGKEHCNASLALGSVQRLPRKGSDREERLASYLHLEDPRGFI